jgi:subtilisin family serine protease
MPCDFVLLGDSRTANVVILIMIMKVPKFTVLLVLTAVSFLVVAQGALRDCGPDDTTNGVSYIPSREAEIAIPARGVTDGQSEEDNLLSVKDVQYLMSSTSSKQPIPDDPYFLKQWTLSKVKALTSWQITKGDPEILVAILDTGIDRNHEDLRGQVVAEMNFTDSPTNGDQNGHGTHVAGIIAAHINNSLGIAGLAAASQLINVKVADDNGESQAEVVADGIIWVVNNGAKVINLSLNFREPSPELESAIYYAWLHGAVVVAAASNDTNQPSYPAYYERAIAVVASRSDDTIGPMSNYGDWVDVAAPGFNVYSTLPGNSYGYMSGTSFATAYVSGLAALLFDVATDINGNGQLNDEIRAAIEAGSQEPGIASTNIMRIDVNSSIMKIYHLAESTE